MKICKTSSFCQQKYRKKKQVSNIFIIIIAIIVMLFFGVSYSIFSSRLTINGTVIAKNMKVDLPVDIQPITPGGTDYVSITADNGVLEVTSQSIAENTIDVNIKALVSTGKPRTLSMSMDFMNNTDYTYTNGTVTYEVTEDTGLVQNQPTKTVTTTVQPGGTGTLSISFSNVKFNSLVTTCKCKFTVTYTVNGEEVQFNVIFNFTR